MLRVKQLPGPPPAWKPGSTETAAGMMRIIGERMIPSELSTRIVGGASDCRDCTFP